MFVGILAASLFPFIYLFYRRKNEYNKLINRGFPVVEPVHWLRGSLNFFLSSTAFSDYGVVSKTLGTTYGAMHGSYPSIVTSDVDLIHAISTTHYDHFHCKVVPPLDPDPLSSSTVHMFNASGERWKRMRAITSQAISARNLKDLYPTIMESIDSFIQFLINQKTGQLMNENFHKIFQNHTSDVLARCAFGQNSSMHGRNLYHQIFSKAFGGYLTIDSFCWTSVSWSLPPLAFFIQRFLNLTDFIKEFCYKNKNPVQEFSELLCSYRAKRVANEQKYDFLQYFKNAEDPSFNGYRAESTTGVVDVSSLRINKKMNPGEIVAQCRFISIAGFDTTANTLAFCCDLLAKNPEIQEELYKEISSVDSFDFNNVLSLPLLHNCIFETLRLYPHASPLQHRKCMSSITINNYDIQEGVCIFIDSWSCHHDASVWGEDVEKFIPQRFDSLNDRQRRAFMPFGVGPRQCVGMRFALLEIKATLCRVMQKYRINTKDPEEKLHLTNRDTGTIWPEHVMLSLTSR